MLETAKRRKEPLLPREKFHSIHRRFAREIVNPERSSQDTPVRSKCKLRFKYTTRHKATPLSKISLHLSAPIRAWIGINPERSLQDTRLYDSTKFSIDCSDVYSTNAYKVFPPGDPIRLESSSFIAAESDTGIVLAVKEIDFK